MKCIKDTHAKAVTMKDIRASTNEKSMMENSGSRGGKYSRFIDFNKPELMSHSALYLLHSIYPLP